MAQPQDMPERPHEDDIPSPAYRVRRMYALDLELSHVGHMRSSLDNAHQRVEYLRKKQSEIQTAKAKQFDSLINERGRYLAAKSHLADFQTKGGKFKGISIKLLSLDWQSEKRMRAEQAAREAWEREQDARTAAEMMEEYEQRLERATNELKEAQWEADMLRAEAAGPDGDMKSLQKREGELRGEIHVLVRGDNRQESDRPDDAIAMWEARGELRPADVVAAWEVGEINDDELRVYCLHTGNTRLLAELEETIQQERSQQTDGQKL